MSSSGPPRKTGRVSRSRRAHLDREVMKRFLAEKFPDLAASASRSGQAANFYPAYLISPGDTQLTGRLGIFAGCLVFVPWPGEPSGRPEPFRNRLIRSVSGFAKKSYSEKTMCVSEREIATPPLKFPLCHVKEFGMTGSVVSISCGRHCETGPAVVHFRSDHAMQLFDAIQECFQNMSNERRLKELATAAATFNRHCPSSVPTHRRSESLDSNVPAHRRRLKRAGTGTPQAVLRSLRGVANRYARRRYSLQTQAQQEQKYQLQQATCSDYHKCPRRRFVTFRKPQYPNTADNYNNDEGGHVNHKSSHESSNSGSNSSAGSCDYHRTLAEIPNSLRALSLSRHQSGKRGAGTDDIFAEIELPDRNNNASTSVPIRGSAASVSGKVHLFKPRFPTPPPRRASYDSDIRNCYQNTVNIPNNGAETLDNPSPSVALNLSLPRSIPTTVGCRRPICLPHVLDESIYQDLSKAAQDKDYPEDIYVEQTLDYSAVQVTGNHIPAQAPLHDNDKLIEEKVEVVTPPAISPPPVSPNPISTSIDTPKSAPIRKLSLGRVIVATNAISKFLTRKTLKSSTTDQTVLPTSDLSVSPSTPSPPSTFSNTNANFALNYAKVDTAKMRAFEILGSDNW